MVTARGPDNEPQMGCTRPMGLFSRRSSPTLDSITFDSRGYESKGDPQPGRQRVWWSPDGDGVGLYMFLLAPDIPKVATIEALHRYYVAQASAAGGGIVETTIVRASGMPVVQVISKSPQQPSGLTYVGALTIAFRDFSYVLKVQCAETGTTGIREATLLDRHLADGGSLDPATWTMDAATHDVEFPAHPLSRARRVLGHLRGSLVVSGEIAKLPGFALPAS